MVEGSTGYFTFLVLRGGFFCSTQVNATQIIVTLPLLGLPNCTATQGCRRAGCAAFTRDADVALGLALKEG